MGIRRKIFGGYAGGVAFIVAIVWNVLDWFLQLIAMTTLPEDWQIAWPRFQSAIEWLEQWGTGMSMPELAMTTLILVAVSLRMGDYRREVAAIRRELERLQPPPEPPEPPALVSVMHDLLDLQRRLSRSATDARSQYGRPAPPPPELRSSVQSVFSMLNGFGVCTTSVPQALTHQNVDTVLAFLTQIYPFVQRSQTQLAQAFAADFWQKNTL